MALYKCNECGKMVTDKASVCPHCGNPIIYILQANIKIDNNVEDGVSSQVVDENIENIQELGQVPGNSDESPQESTADKSSDTSKGEKILLSIGIIGIIVAVLFIILKVSEGPKVKSYASSASTVVDSAADRYTIAIYSDNTGEFLNPQGGRICGVELEDFNSNWYEIKLTRNLDILGYSSNYLYVSGDYIYANRYLGNNGTDRTMKQVEMRDSADVRLFSFYLQEGDIEKQVSHIEPVDISKYMLKNNYLMVVYDEKENSINYANGTLYDPTGKRMCGVNGTNNFREYYEFPKKIKLLGDSTGQLYISNGYLYANHFDYYKAVNLNENVANKLKINQNKVGNATIITFANNPQQVSSSTKRASTTTSTSTSTSTSASSSTTTSTKSATSSDPAEVLSNLLSLPDGIRFGNDKMQMTHAYYYRTLNEVEFKFTQYIFPKEAAEADPLLIPELTKSLIETRKEALRSVTKLMNAMAPLKPKIRDILYYPDGTKCCEYTFEYSEM